ncbi:hypothetical protein, partial [Methylobacterium sp. WL64]|uniref:hypothetical protein n=1 Tax=Methylobacterium sp. WL64 TaxID=2603894 RepID=UPI001AED5B13
ALDWSNGPKICSSKSSVSSSFALACFLAINYNPVGKWTTMKPTSALPILRTDPVRSPRSVNGPKLPISREASP